MIDWTRVDELRAEVGEDGFDEVVELFLEETDEVADRLISVSDGDLGRDMHFLKGSALNLGLRALAQMCHDGERLCGSGRGGEVDRPALVHLYEAAKTALKEGLARRSAA